MRYFWRYLITRHSSFGTFGDNGTIFKLPNLKTYFTLVQIMDILPILLIIFNRKTKLFDTKCR